MKFSTTTRPSFISRGKETRLPSSLTSCTSGTSYAMFVTTTGLDSPSPATARNDSPAQIRLGRKSQRLDMLPHPLLRLGEARIRQPGIDENLLDVDLLGGVDALHTGLVDRGHHQAIDLLIVP